MQGLTEVQPLVLAIAIFSGIIAVALIVMTCCAIAVLLAAKRMEARSAEFLDAWQPAAAEAGQAVRNFAEQSGELLSRLNSLTAHLQKQSMQVEASITSLAALAQRNAESVDVTLRSTLDRFNDATRALEQALRLPVNQLRALGAGLTAGLRNLTGGRQRDPARISADKEMFL